MKDYNEIDDITDMVKLMEALHISTKGLNGLDEMKGRVRDELKRVDKTPRSTEEESFESILLAAKQKEEAKGVLRNFYTKVDTHGKKIPKDDFDLLQNHLGNIKEIMKVQMDQLKQDKYCLLVTGETSAGKSSLLNLLLGEQILLNASKATTSTICEIKHGEDPKIVAHFKDKDPGTGKKERTILLEQPTGSSQKSYLEQISPYVAEKGSSFKKIELFLPHPFLKNGIMIVDSPGIGDKMDDIALQYLSKAFAFIYVIDSPRAGGVQEKGLGDWFKKSFQALVGELKSEQGEGSFEVLKLLQSKCALFVCNKWDQVKGSEDVKKVVKDELKRYWPGFDPESQLIYLSTEQALLAQEYGIMTDEFLSLMNGMRSVVLNAIGAKLEIQWSLLHYLLKRIIVQSKVFLKQAASGREKGKQEMEEVLFRLKKIKKQGAKVIDDLSKDLEASINKVETQLAEYLSSKDVEKRFTTWKKEEVPAEPWKDAKVQIVNLLSSRLQELIEKWEEDNNLFANAHESFVQRIQKQFNTVAVQLDELQRLASGFTWSPTRRDDSSTRQWPWMLSAGAFFGSAILSFTFGIENRDRLLQPLKFAPSAFERFSNAITQIVDIPVRYKWDKKSFMESTSKTYLSVASKKEVITNYVRDKLSGLSRSLDEIEDHLPKLIEADEKLYSKLKTDERSSEHLRKVYQPLKNEASKLRGELAKFGIRNVCAVDITSKELVWKEDVPSCLGSGRFGAVYHGQMKRNEDVKTVALKVYKGELAASDASAVVDEVQCLGTLNHPNIVKFYGTSLAREADNVRVILVMEKCKGDLRGHIFKSPSSVPGKSGEPAVVMKTCRWVKEITDALTYIHAKGIIHRDLKLENILLSEENSVKIGDVGQSKEEEDITGTFAGTPLYLAPEVFRGEKYDCKADIYRLGIILWEMWYGRQAFLFDAPTNQQEFFSWVQEGNRPVHIKDCKKPPPIWEDMMTSCWDGDPEKRPTAEKCNEDIATLCAE